MYEDDDSSNTATHSQDRIGEYEDMELDDLDESNTVSNDEYSNSTGFNDERTKTQPTISSLYDDDEDANQTGTLFSIQIT